MFSPETYLASHSTTWIAAKQPNHLTQHNYTIAKVPSSVKRIMVLIDPSLPTALSTLPHLFRVVRIYSNSVEHECKDLFVLLRCKTSQVQPINVLDTLDDDHNGDEDLHLMNPEEIMLTDRIPSVHSPPKATQVERCPDANNEYNPGMSVPTQQQFNQPILPTSQRDTLDAQPSGNNFSPFVLMESPPIPQPQRRGRKRKHVLDEPTVTNRSPYVLRRRRNVASSSLDPEGMSGPSSPQNFDPPTIQACGVNNSPNLMRPESSPNSSMGVLVKDPNTEHNLENHQVFQNLQEKGVEPNSDQTMNENDHVSEMIPDLDPEGMPVSSLQHFNTPTPHTSQGDTLDGQPSGGNNSSPFVLMESPPIPQPQRRGRKRKHVLDEPTVTNRRNVASSSLDPEGMSGPSSPQNFDPPTTQACGVNNSRNLMRPESSPTQQPQRKGRKRKQFFDETTVLTNRSPYALRKRKKASSNSLDNRTLNGLNDTCGKQRERRDVPSSSSGSRKLNNNRRKKRNFDQPLLAGISKDHLVIFEEDNVDADQPLEEPVAANANQPPEEPVAANANQPAEEPIADTNQTSEEPAAATNQTSEEPIVATSSVTAFDMESEQVCNVDVTPPPTIQALNIVEGTNITSERMQTHLAASPGADGSEMMQMPDSVAHLLINSSRTNELWFLTMDQNTTSSSRGTSGSINRTRHEAQYLERLSSSILEEDARIFFEVLVLKTNGCVDVQQEEPYGDVSLKLAPTPSNAQS